MKICVAQTRPVKGDIQSNIENHIKLIDLAILNGADTIIFPELSITGYEPELAKQLATNQDDRRFTVFQQISDTSQVTIGVGVPTKSDTDTCISTILFRPHRARQTYSKKYLHADEEEYFCIGKSSTNLIESKTNIALAICYELLVPAHAENAFRNGAEIYIVSAVKSVEGVDKAIERLSEVATKYSMIVLLSNCVGTSGGIKCGGKTSVWNKEGLLAAQLNDTDEGIIILDTETQEVIERTI